MDKKESYLKLFRALVNQLKNAADELSEFMVLEGFWKKQYPEIYKILTKQDNPIKKLTDIIDEIDGLI